jgi:hypothetical protein
MGLGKDDALLCSVLIGNQLSHLHKQYDDADFLQMEIL